VLQVVAAVVAVVGGPKGVAIAAALNAAAKAIAPKEEAGSSNTAREDSAETLARIRNSGQEAVDLFQSLLPADQRPQGQSVPT
jgi:hypothetical protein